MNAAIDGAADGRRRRVLVNDAHWTMQNIRPGALHHHASYLSGKHKPLYMMEGLDGTFDAVFMRRLPRRDRRRARDPVAHLQPRRDLGGRLNGHAVGESALNALVALHHGVPVVLITGDEATAEEARPFLPEIEARGRQALDHPLRRREPPPGAAPAS